jgi:hypothetical protein
MLAQHLVCLVEFVASNSHLFGQVVDEFTGYIELAARGF